MESLRWRVLLVSGLACGMLIAACGSEGSSLLVGPGTVPATGTSETSTTLGDEVESTEDPGPDSTIQAGPVDSFDLDDAVIQAALVEGAMEPLAGLPGRDVLATELLNHHLATAGIDLTGMELVVYPAGPIPSFILMVTSDSTSLFALEGEAGDDAVADPFFAELLGSPVVGDFGIEKLIMRHSSTDEEGPFVLTMTVRFADLQDGLSNGADIFDRMAVQVERG